MSADESLFVVCTSEFDPERCAGHEEGTRPCKYKKVGNSLYCPRHGGVVNKNLVKRATLAHYNLTAYNETLAPLANSTEIKSLRDEIAILRMTLGNVLEQTKGNRNTLLVYTDKIASLCTQIGGLIEKCQKIEERNSDLLDRKVVLVIAEEIISVMKIYVTDPDQLLAAGARIVETIEQIGSVKTLASA